MDAGGAGVTAGTGSDRRAVGSLPPVSSAASIWAVCLADSLAVSLTDFGLTLAGGLGAPGVSPSNLAGIDLVSFVLGSFVLGSFLRGFLGGVVGELFRRILFAGSALAASLALAASSSLAASRFGLPASGLPRLLSFCLAPDLLSVADRALGPVLPSAEHRGLGWR